MRKYRILNYGMWEAYLLIMLLWLGAQYMGLGMVNSSLDGLVRILFFLTLLGSIQVVLTVKAVQVHYEVAVPLVGGEEEVMVTFWVENTSYLPTSFVCILLQEQPGMTLVEGEPTVCLLLPKQKRSYTYRYTAWISGKREIMVEGIVAYGIVGSLEARIQGRSTCEIGVMPQTPSEEETDITRQEWMTIPSVAERGYVSGEIGDTFRAYQPGDARKLIHWKQVARRDYYAVRQQEEKKIKKPEQHYILATYREWEYMELLDYQCEGWALDQLMTLLAYTLIKECRAVVHYRNNRQTHVAMVEDKWSYGKLLKDLAYYSFSSQEAVDSWWNEVEIGHEVWIISPTRLTALEAIVSQRQGEGYSTRWTIMDEEVGELDA